LQKKRKENKEQTTFKANYQIDNITIMMMTLKSRIQSLPIKYTINEHIKNGIAKAMPLKYILSGL
jgi:hypothetical protein